MRQAVLIVALLFVFGFLALTIATVRENGFNILSFFAFVICAMLGFGVIGALRQPPE